MPLAVHVLRRRSTRRLGRKEAQWRAGQGTAISFLFCIKAFSGGPSACTLSTCVYTKCSAGMGSRQTDRATVSSELGALGIRRQSTSAQFSFSDWAVKCLDQVQYMRIQVRVTGPSK